MKALQGVVISLKRTKVVTVTVSRRWQHPLYKKFVKRSKKYSCRYEGIKLELGDQVLIESCRPISKTVHFKVVSKMGKAAKQLEKEALSEIKEPTIKKPKVKKPKVEKKSKTKSSTETKEKTKK